MADPWLKKTPKLPGQGLCHLNSVKQCLLPCPQPVKLSKRDWSAICAGAMSVLWMHTAVAVDGTETCCTPALLYRSRWLMICSVFGIVSEWWPPQIQIDDLTWLMLVGSCFESVLFWPAYLRHTYTVGWKASFHTSHSTVVRGNSRSSMRPWKRMKWRSFRRAVSWCIAPPFRMRGAIPLRTSQACRSYTVFACVCLWLIIQSWCSTEIDQTWSDSISEDITRAISRSGSKMAIDHSACASTSRPISAGEVKSSLEHSKASKWPVRRVHCIANCNQRKMFVSRHVLVAYLTWLIHLPHCPIRHETQAEVYICS